MHFWNRWRKEYLTDLREHHHIKGECNNKVSTGKVVLVHKDNVKRSNWTMRKEEEFIVGKDKRGKGC